MLKAGVLDPQGDAVQHALEALGFDEVKQVRQGKLIDMELAFMEEAAAKSAVADMCEKLLANTVIESYTIEILP